MNTAAAIYENLVTTRPRENGGRSKAASEAFGDSSQQRFSDVLPLAQAAKEQVSETETPEEAPADAPLTTAEDAVDPPLEEEAPAQEEESEIAYSQVVGWPFAEWIPPVVQSQVQGTAAVQAVDVTMGEQTTESSAFGVTGMEQLTSAGLSTPATTSAASTVGQTPGTEGIPQSQAVPKDLLVENPAAANTVTTVTIPDEQGVALVATGADEQASAVPETSPEAAPISGTKTAKILPDEMQIEQPEVQDESAQGSSGPETADAASQHESQDGMMSGTRNSDNRSQGQTLEVEQASVRAQSTSSQASDKSVLSSKSQTESYERGAASKSYDDSALESVEVAATENPNVSLDPVEGKGAPAVAIKETGIEGATAPELRVSAVGETSVSSPRVGSQTQSLTTAQASLPQTPVQSIGEQILDSVRASMANGDRQVSIRLLPPELGTVVVRFQEQGERLNGVVEVSNSDIQREVERALPQVIRSLQEAGVQIRRVEVVTADQPDNRNLGGENLPQDVWQQHQGAGQSREHAYASQQTRWSQSLGGQSIGGQGVSGEQSRAAAAQGRIDLLL